MLGIGLKGLVPPFESLFALLLTRRLLPPSDLFIHYEATAERWLAWLRIKTTDTAH